MIGLLQSLLMRGRVKLALDRAEEAADDCKAVLALIEAREDDSEVGAPECGASLEENHVTEFIKVTVPKYRNSRVVRVFACTVCCLALKMVQNYL